jgi:predicted methyltransferase
MHRISSANILAVVSLAACAHDPPPAAKPAALDTTQVAAVVASPDRSDRDKQRDTQRKPTELLVFVGVAPGMHVADLGAGGGYTAELLARAVGPHGSVIAQDTPHWGVPDDPGLVKLWQTTRLAKPAITNLAHVARGWTDPLPPDAKNLDAVTFVAAFHDVVAEHDDETKLDAAVFAALRPGGVFVVIDNSAKAGTGKADCERLHRIDEQVVRDEVQRAGFKLVATSDFMRRPDDTRDWNADPDAADPAHLHQQDLFALKFVKP